MTLLLGPPGSGKTTLLKALAGRMDSSLRATGQVTLNGHTHDEFVPQRTAAYISQRDLHVGEMTVRETLDFSAKCQGVGARYGRASLKMTNLCSFICQVFYCASKDQMNLKKFAI